MTGSVPTIEEIVEAFELIDDWEERYQYVIELGRMLPPFPENQRDDQHKVRGCVSQVWLVTEIEAGQEEPARLHFLGDSDALIVRGLVAILLSLYDGKTAAEIRRADVESLLSQIGLREHLTPQRSNGLTAMVRRIQADADAVPAAAA